MTKDFNVSGCVHPAGESYRPALTVNGKTWVKPQDCATITEASDAAKALVYEISIATFAQLIAAGLTEVSEPSRPAARC